MTEAAKGQETVAAAPGRLVSCAVGTAALDATTLRKHGRLTRQDEWAPPGGLSCAAPYTWSSPRRPRRCLGCRRFKLLFVSCACAAVERVPWTADFTRDIALNYVKRGYHLLCRHAVTLLLMPVAATVLVRAPVQHAVLEYSVAGAPRVRLCRLHDFQAAAGSMGKRVVCARALEAACRYTMWSRARAVGAGQHGEDGTVGPAVGGGMPDEPAVQPGALRLAPGDHRVPAPPSGPGTTVGSRSPTPAAAATASSA